MLAPHQVVVPCKYDRATGFFAGMAAVQMNGKWGFLAIDGYNTAYASTQTVDVDGKAADLAAFTLTDDAGGGYTYYKLRDLGATLGFKVDWTAQRGIFIETK